MIDRVDTRELSGCMWLALRRTTRRVTQVYDRALGAAGVTSTQFTILAFLEYKDGRSIGMLADALGMDPTTLNRNLKPLLRARLVRNGADAKDGRIRTVLLTEKGRAKLRQGVPLWRDAQRKVKAAWGVGDFSTLRDLLRGSYDKLSV